MYVAAIDSAMNFC